MKQFLLVYNRSDGKLVEAPKEYAADEQERAAADRYAREMKERELPQIEVVLLGADSLEALKKTHTRYFERMGERMQTMLARTAFQE